MTADRSLGPAGWRRRTHAQPADACALRVDPRRRLSVLFERVS